MAERRRLTDASVRRLPLPRQGKTITPDSEVMGFGARVTANGARSYVLRYTTRAGRERNYTIGDATIWRTTDARHKARELRRDALHRKVTAAGHPYQANRTVALLSKMFALAVRWRWRDSNPAKGIERNIEYHRRRYISGDELVRLTKALAEHGEQQVANAVKIMLLTGARRGEVLGMRWADLDLRAGVWSKPASSTKQKAHHQVPLSAPALSLLSEIDKQQRRAGKRLTFVFPGNGGTGHLVEIKKGWAALCKAADIDGLRIHDLRHSYASQLVSSGASLPLIGALLGHANPSTTARYAHLAHDPMREATERVGSVIVNAGKPAPEPAKLSRGRS